MALGGMKPFGFASVIVAGLLDRRNLRSGRSNTSLHGPGGETTLRGIGQNARSTRFEGRQLISENRTSMPGSQVARPRLATPRKPARGRASSGPIIHEMVEFQSATASGETCAVKSGNAFGSD